MKSSSDYGKGILIKVRSGFSSLQGSPTELWTAYSLKFLDSYAYFSFSLIFTLFLSEDFGFSDIAAGTVFGAWGALITIYGLLAGCIVDNLGVATSLRLGFVLSLIARVLICFTASRLVLLLSICLILPAGNCLGIPVLTTGIRRYTTLSNRGFAFGLFYVIMNVAALISGPVVDICTIRFGRKDGEEPATEWSLTSYRIIILTGIAANVIACILTLTVREIKVDGAAVECATVNAFSVDENVRDSLQMPNSPDNTRTFRPVKGSPMQILKETVQTRRFWRFLAVCLITLNVRMIFRHLDATLPKYMIREFGDDVKKGTIYSINPAMIIVLVPLVTAATTTTDPLIMIHHGSYISALSVGFLVLSTSIPACILFVVTLSIGEAVWSPRLYDYTMSVVPEGREGTYMAITSAPLFLAKLPVGFMSGYLLQRFCPEEGERHSKIMWLIIGLTTIVSPILLTIFWGYVSKKDDDESSRYTELHDVQHNDLASIPTETSDLREEVRIT